MTYSTYTLNNIIKFPGMKKISIVIAAVVSISFLTTSCTSGERCPAYGAKITPTDNTGEVSAWMGQEEQINSSVVVSMEE
jgi:hypothetical protein